MQTNYTIALTGANGFVGKHLQNTFGHAVVLHRDDSVDVLIDKLKGVDVVINLAGAPIVKRWSKSYKSVLYKSRIETTRKLVEAVNQSEVGYFISTSAIGIYPNNKRANELSTEYADNFLANLCVDWESEALKCIKPTAIVRFGVVLGKDGGALQKMLLPFKLGLGGVIGDGKMMTSWIHISDLLKMYEFLIAHKAEGVYNAVAPHPITNSTFTKALGKALGKPTFMPLPIFVLKAMYGEASCVLTDSKEVFPKQIEAEGFVFEHDTIDDALVEIFKGDHT